MDNSFHMMMNGGDDSPVVLQTEYTPQNMVNYSEFINLYRPLKNHKQQMMIVENLNQTKTSSLNGSMVKTPY